MRPVGVVLAGGAGRRMGGDKATVAFDGIPLLQRALHTLGAVTETQAVVAKADTALPTLGGGVALWCEPAWPRHPAVGIAHALARAGGRPVLCVAVDLPLLDPATLRGLLDADDGEHSCVVACAAGRVEPLCALWRPAAGPALARPDGVPMRRLIRALGPLRVEVPEPRALVNVNTREDLARALRSRRPG